MKKKISIYVVTHKEYNFPKDVIYMPLVVGANKNKIGEHDNTCCDNTGDNISDKNSSFCELTGLYWIWKNNVSNIVGLTHYRRYFFKNNLGRNLQNVIDSHDIISKLDKADIILPNKKYLIDGNVYSDYAAHHNIRDFDKCISIIKKKYPEYSGAINKVLKRKYLYSFNMFISKKEIIDKYCKWLFDILFELEKNTDISSYDNYNKRIYGFLSERLFNIWVLKNNLTIVEIPVLNVEENFFQDQIVNLIKRICLIPIIYIFVSKIVKIKRMKG